MSEERIDYVFKVLLLGDGAVGKTSLISMFTQGFMKKDYKMTIGVDIMAKTVRVGDTVAKLSIWDLAGQQRFKAIRGAFYGGVAGAMLVFDLTRAITFKNLVNWLEELYQYGSPDVPVILIGNKSDLPKLREVKDEDIEWFATEIGCEYLLTSAKTGENVENAFYLLTKKMIEHASGKAIKVKQVRKNGEKYYTSYVEKVEVPPIEQKDEEAGEVKEPEPEDKEEWVF
ncbi:MAG: Rab family GTPase [Candidatus Odinarchaeia archaeon]